jgi:hypothetical protein
MTREIVYGSFPPTLTAYDGRDQVAHD